MSFVAPADPGPRRWLAVGQSADPVTPARPAWPPPRALVQSRPRAARRLLLRGLRPGRARGRHREEVAGDTPLVGCSTAGRDLQPPGRATPAWSSPPSAGPGSRSPPAAADAAGGRLREAGAEVAACLDRVADKAPPGAAAAHRRPRRRPAGDRAGRLPGRRRRASRSSAAAPVTTCAWPAPPSSTTARSCRNAVVAAAIASDAPLGIGVRHGWRRVGRADARHPQRGQPGPHPRRRARPRRVPRPPRRARRGVDGPGRPSPASP